MAFEFSRFINGGTERLVSETRLSALSGYAIYKGEALTITGGCLGYAASAQKVYAISNVSVASSVVTAGYHPEVFPVNENQVWKGTVGTAVTAAFVAGKRTNLSSGLRGTAVACANAGTGSAMYVVEVVTSDPLTSAVYVAFPGFTNLVTG